MVGCKEDERDGGKGIVVLRTWGGGVQSYSGVYKFTWKMLREVFKHSYNLSVKVNFTVKFRGDFIYLALIEGNIIIFIYIYTIKIFLNNLNFLYL